MIKNCGDFDFAIVCGMPGKQRACCAKKIAIVSPYWYRHVFKTTDN